MRRFGQYSLAILFLLLIVELVLISPQEVKENPEMATTTPQISTAATLTDPATGLPIPAIDPATGQPITDGTAIRTGIESTNPGDIEQMMEGIHVIETRNERKEWELWSDKAVGLKDQGNLNLEKVKASFFSTNGVSFLVTGQNGAVESKTKNMTVVGDVQTRSSNGYLLKTTSMNYDSKERLLKSPSPVQVAGPSEGPGQSLYLEGQEMAADLEKGEITVVRNVKARKAMGEDPKMNVTADKVTLSGNTKGMRFEGAVVINMNGVKITGPAALFKYDTKSQLLESIELEGGVRVSDYDKWATSDKLKIDVAKNAYVFDGRPRVVQDNDEVRGDKIIFLDGGKKVKVQNAKIKVSQDTLQKESSNPGTKE